MKWRFPLTLFLAVAGMASTSAASETVSLQPGTDRLGADYNAFALDQADPQLCRQACAGDAACKAYTYANPGVKGAAAMCFLKSSVAPATANDCCTSGAKTTLVVLTPVADSPKLLGVPTVPKGGLNVTTAAEPLQLLKAINELKAQAAQQQAAIAQLKAQAKAQQDVVEETTSLLANANNNIQALQAAMAAANKATATQQAGNGAFNQTLVDLNASLATLRNAFTTFKTEEYAEHRHRLSDQAIVGNSRAGDGSVEFNAIAGSDLGAMMKKLRVTSRPVME